MLAGGSDVLYRKLLATNNIPVSRIEVWRSGTRIDSYGPAGVPFNTAAVSATLTSRMARSFSFSVHDSLYPENSAALLAPAGNEIRVSHGVSGGGGPNYMWPVFRGRLDSVDISTEGLVSITAVDRAGDVADSEFARPMNSAEGSRLVDEFKRLVKDAVPDAVFGTSDDLWERVPKLTWEASRADALDQLASGAHSYWYPLADGTFVIRRIPWTQSNPAVLSLTDGPGGHIVSATITKTRSGVVNFVIATGERSDGTPPVFATAQDDDPNSPTYIRGPFGVKAKNIGSQSSASQGQALAMARAYLKRSKALTEAWSTTMVADASLELGDVANLQATFNGKVRKSTQVLASYTLSLTGEPMSASWRAQGTLE